jgi:hypothetical protein
VVDSPFRLVHGNILRPLDGVERAMFNIRKSDFPNGRYSFSSLIKGMVYCSLLFALLGGILSVAGYYFEESKHYDVWTHGINGSLTGAFVGAVLGTVIGFVVWIVRVGKS